VARHVGVEDEVLAITANTVVIHWPLFRVQNSMIVWITVVYKRRPHTGHQMTRSIERGGLSLERVDCIAKTLRVVENEGHLLEMAYADQWWVRVDNDVKPVTIGTSVVVGPLLASEATASDDYRRNVRICVVLARN